MLYGARRARNLVAASVTALSLAATATAEIRKKPEIRKKDPDPPAPAVEPPEPRKLEPADAARLETLALRLRSWDDATITVTRHGLRAQAQLVPDAMAHHLTSSYLRLREAGKDHAGAIHELARSLPRWKRYESQGLLRIRLSNEKHRLSPTDRRIFTLERSLSREGVQLRDARGRLFPLSLAGYPSNLRSAKVRVKKFWKTADGVTRRVRPPDDPSRDDPLSFGRSPYLSKPVPAAVLEGKESTIDLLVPTRALEKAAPGAFVVKLHSWKRYEGPFEKDVIDLNANRVWEELEDLSAQISLPPSGLEVSPELTALVEEVRDAAK